MNPLLLALLAGGVSASMSGLQAYNKTEANNNYIQQMTESLNKYLQDNLYLLAQQADQYNTAQQLEINERLRQHEKDLGLLKVSAAAANIKGNSLLRQSTIQNTDVNRDIDIRKQNVLNILKQNYWKQEALKNQTLSKIASLRNNKENPAVNSLLAGTSSLLQWIPTMLSV